MTPRLSPDLPVESPRGLPRWFEWLTAATGIVLAAPLFVLIALAIKLDSRGPVLFRQRRMGAGGRTFELLKFRSMRVESKGREITVSGDSRISRVGRVLRKTKLDELPSLLNIIRSEMSLVGPRPEVPVFVDLRDPLWLEVLQSRPGLTDPSTLALRDEEFFLASVSHDPTVFYRSVLLPAKLRHSAAYLARRTWKSDLGIIARTLVAIMRPRSLSEEQLRDFLSGRHRKG